jgi:outer membrane protein assembly factor BamB
VRSGGRRAAGRATASEQPAGPPPAGRGRRVAGRPLALPRWWVAALSAFVLVVVAAVVVVVRLTVPPCRDALVDTPHHPLLGVAQMRDQPDAHLDQLAAAVTAMAAPFGDVLGGVGYDYNQWIHLYGLDAGMLAFTKNNAPVTLLDPRTLGPRWSLRPDSKDIAWDASADRFLLLDLSARADTRVSAYDVADGHRVWCASVGQRHRSGAPVSTTFLAGDAVLTALPEGDRIAVTRLSHTGATVWSRSYAGASRADYLGPLTDRLVVVGGTEEYHLADQAPSSKAGPVITAFDARDGKPAWSWDAEADSLVHVVGVDSGRVLAVERGADGVHLLSLSDAGRQLWSTSPADAAYEATLRGGVVVMKSASGLSGYDDRTGRPLWNVKVPTDRTYFPYGFTLAQMPSLDDTHVLVPTTTALVVLDVRDGSEVSYPLPVDGINTTYWPYQLLATPDLLGVVTNTGAVVTRRSGG